MGDIVPVTITSFRDGSTASCHLCDWRATFGHSGFGVKPRHAQQASAAWAAHWRAAHCDEDDK